MKKFKAYNYNDIQIGDCVINARNSKEAQTKAIAIFVKHFKVYLRDNITVYEMEEK